MLNVLQIPPSELFALLVAIGFAAGLNLYATVAVLGLLARFGHLPLPPGLFLLAGWPVIAVSTTLFFVEFFADKIPAVALIAPSGKTPARAAVTPSPEPFSNITLSLGEDVLAIALTWVATRHPYIAGTVATLLVVIIIILTRWVIRAMRALFRGAEHDLVR